MTRLLHSGGHDLPPAVESGFPPPPAAGRRAIARQAHIKIALEAASRASGQPLDRGLGEVLEARFGQNLSAVRINTDQTANAAARTLGAKAFTAGQTIAFGYGQYRPQNPDGLFLLAHEIAHVLQSPAQANPASGNWRLSQVSDAAESAADRAAQQVSDDHSTHVLPSGPEATVSRSPDDSGWMETADEWWGKKKEAAYDSLIGGIRSLKQSGLSELRSLAQDLPAALQPIADMVIDQVEIGCDLLISLGLAIVGIVVGLVSGIAHAVWGLLTLLHGVIYGLILFVAGIFDTRYRNEFDEKANALLNGLKNLPANLRVLWNAWKAKFSAVSAERQSLMIGELTGEIESILLAAMAGGGAAGAAPKLTLAPLEQFAFASGRAAAGGGAVAIDLAGPGAGALLAVNMANQIDNQAQTTTKNAKKQEAPKAATQKKPDPSTSTPPLKNAAEVDKMWQELGEDMRTQKPAPHKGGIKEAMKDAQGFRKGDQPGEVNLEAQAHKDASDVREVRKVKGKDFQSAHGGASSWLNKRIWRKGKLINIDYSRADAVSTLLPPDVHQSFDKLWKTFAIETRQGGLDRVPVSEMLRVMRQAVGTSALAGAQQGSLMMIIESEISELGLALTDVIELPYPNVTAP